MEHHKAKKEFYKDYKYKKLLDELRAKNDLEEKKEKLSYHASNF